MFSVAFLLTLPTILADTPLKSGLTPPQRPGPYSALVVVGPQRGTQHCYICEAEDRPVVIVFARTLGEPLGKLVHELDRQLKKHAPSELRGWVTVLASDAIVTEPKVIAWSQKHATGGVPIAVFEDMVGPPAYRIARDADITVLLSVKQKTVANYAFRAGELNDAFVERISRNVSGMVESKK